MSLTWQLILSRQAVKDAKNLSGAGLKKQAVKLLELLQTDPLAAPPRFEKLVGNLRGYYSRRINIQHRLVYRLDEERRIVHVLRMWSHYE